MNQSTSPWRQVLQMPVIVASLGYFVDIYALLLFSIVRVASLKSLGITDPELITTQGVHLINVQMVGLLIGGILWGILGDKKGRISVLFGSILIYSVANIANGFATSVEQYAIWRFIAGVGLAGELGVGITLVAEILPKETRGYGTSLVAAVGLLGAVLAYFVADHFTWQTSYFIGGGLGLVLLALRVSVFESGIFTRVKEKKVARGNFFQLFGSGKQFMKYFRCILLGIPVWYVAGILMTFSPEFGKALNLDQPIIAGKAVMWEYIGLSIGDLGSGLLSQYFRSRKKVVFLFIVMTTILSGVYLYVPLHTATMFYALCTVIGVFVGYWALFVTIAAEQFGTNIRSTVATTVPNFVRGSLTLLTSSFLMFRAQFGILEGAALLGLITMGIALLGLWGMDETFGKDLDYVEGHEVHE
jgi:MFS family permease